MAEPGDFDELSYLRAEVKRLRKALNTLTPGIGVLLRRRGFHIYKKEPSEDLFIPAPDSLDAYYVMLHKYSFRLFLRDVIKKQELFCREDVTRYATSAVTSGYIDYLESIGLIIKSGVCYRLFKHIKSFGETLEWYIAEMFKREFGAEALWGVKFKRPKIGGDYDLIARLDSSVVYAEVKSSPPKQIYDKEIGAFLDRVGDLAPEISLFFIDTELRMKDKIVPMFEKELSIRYGVPPEVVRVERELFRIGEEIFIVNAKDGIVANFARILNRFYRRRG